ncbi:MAG: hypothetical protein R3284_05550 [Rubricoccaceae bacterium]|nr:hypothetical protein [Rubricoccaceae bacterium]
MRIDDPVLMVISHHTVFRIAFSLIVLWSVGSAGAQSPDLDSTFVWQERTVSPPATIEADSLFEDGDVYAVDYTVVGADGERFAPFTSGAGFPSVTEIVNGWVQISLGCGTACTVSVIVDPATGRISNTIYLLATIDFERGLAAAFHDAGIVIFDPFGSYVQVPLERPDDSEMGFSEWLGQIEDVQFLTDQDALYVTRLALSGREVSWVIPFNDTRGR